LRNPAYDAGNGTLTYEANILTDYRGEGLRYAADQRQDQTIAEEFGRASLFIDDCPDQDVLCYNGDVHFNPNAQLIGDLGSSGWCWQWSEVACVQCRNYDDVCNNTFGGCNGQCLAFTHCGRQSLLHTSACTTI
jgi:hypothetical protein